MENETRAALAIGLLIIVGFAIVLSQVKGPPSDSALSPAEATGGEFTSHALVPLVDDVAPEDYRRGAPRLEVARQPMRRPDGDRTAELPRTASPGRPSRRYTVQPSDSLSRIARRVYGSSDPKYYKLIYQANRDTLPDIATVRAGQVLVIPPAPDGAPVRSARLDGGGTGRGSVALRGGGTR